MWDPFGASAWGSLLKHTIDLFERQTLGFRDKNVGVDKAGGAEGAPYEKDTGAEISFARVGTDHIRGDDGDDTVPKPVGGGR